MKLHVVIGGNSRYVTAAEFLALAHAHVIADVTGLQAALDAKIDDSQAGATGLAVLSATNTATLQALVDLEIGVDVQAYSAYLAALAALVDPNADRILFWDDSAGAYAFLQLGTNLSITGTTINAAAGSSGPSLGLILALSNVGN